MARAAMTKAKAQGFLNLVDDTQAAESARSMGSKIKAPNGAFSIPAIFIGLVTGTKPSLYSTYVDVITLPVDPATTYIPMVTTIEGENVPAIAVDATTGAVRILVGRTLIVDPSGAKNLNQTPKKLPQWHALEKPYEIRPQQHMRIWVNGKLEDSLKDKPKAIVLGGCYLEPYSYKVKNSEEMRDGRSIKASGIVALANTTRLLQLPLIPRLRELMPYETQTIPTADELRGVAMEHVADEDEGRPAVEGEDTAAAAAASGRAGVVIGGGTTRLEVASFPGHADVLPTEEVFLSGKATRGLTVVAADVPRLLISGAEYKEGEVKKTRRPRIGDGKATTLRLLVKRSDDIANMSDENVKKLAMDIPIYGDALVNFPSWFVPLADALIRGTDTRPPMPFTVLAMVNQKETLGESRPPPEGSEDGIITGSVRNLGILFDVRGYVEKYGIRVSHKLVHDGRFGKGVNANMFVDEAKGDSMALWITDAFDGKSDAQHQSMVRYDVIDNADGVAILDVLVQGMNVLSKKVDGAEVCYYVLPLVNGVAACERRDDPAAGDQFVKQELVRLGHLGAGDDLYAASVKDASIYLQGEVREYDKHKAWLPVFCFFAVMAPRTAAGVDPYAPVEQPSQRRLRLAAEVAARNKHEDKVDKELQEADAAHGRKRSANEAKVGDTEEDVALKHLDGMLPKRARIE